MSIKKIIAAAGFSIEGGTRRLIAANFGIYSRLLCVQVAFLFFVLFCKFAWVVSELLFRFFCFLHDCDLIRKPGNLLTVLDPIDERHFTCRHSRWNMVTSPYVPKWEPSVPTRCRKNLPVSLASRRANRRKLKVNLKLYCALILK